MKAMTAAVLVLTVPLGACQRQSSNTPQVPAAPTRTAPVAARQATATEQLTGMVEAASQGKSQVPVMLKFDLLERPVVGQPVTLALAVLPQVPAGPVAVDVAGARGIDMVAGDQHFEFPTVDGQQAYLHRITVTPTIDGVQVLNLTVSLKHDEVTDTRSFAIPLIVAPGPASAADVPAGAGGAQAPSTETGRPGPAALPGNPGTGS